MLACVALLFVGGWRASRYDASVARRAEVAATRTEALAAVAAEQKRIDDLAAIRAADRALLEAVRDDARATREDVRALHDVVIKALARGPGRDN